MAWLGRRRIGAHVASDKQRAGRHRQRQGITQLGVALEERRRRRFRPYHRRDGYLARFRAEGQQTAEIVDGFRWVVLQHLRNRRLHQTDGDPGQHRVGCDEKPRAAADHGHRDEQRRDRERYAAPVS